MLEINIKPFGYVLHQTPSLEACFIYLSSYISGGWNFIVHSSEVQYLPVHRRTEKSGAERRQQRKQTVVTWTKRQRKRPEPTEAKRRLIGRRGLPHHTSQRILQGEALPASENGFLSLRESNGKQVLWLFGLIFFARFALHQIDGHFDWSQL